jgi:hypothetical protein
MTGQIQIKDSRGFPALRFDNFAVRSDYKFKNQIFISFRVTITLHGNSLAYYLDGELSDFEEMLNHLETMQRDLKRTFFFQHSDERIRIRFSPDDLGHIRIEGYASSVDFNLKTEFRFETDQSFLNELIEECRAVIGTIKVKSI